MSKDGNEFDSGIKVLVDPVEYGALGAGQDVVDIVAIHGIGADPDDSWSGRDREDKKVYWLQDEKMLPKAVPTARIMRFGYQSIWYGTNGAQPKKTYVSDVAEMLLRELKFYRNDISRPIVFIAHSYGGLVLIQALRRSFDNPNNWSNPFRATAGIVFFGTPFRGRGGLSLEQIVNAVAENNPEIHIYPETMALSVAGNPYLQDIVSRFTETRRGDHPVPLWCFYETQPSPISKVLLNDAVKDGYLVPEESACIDNSKYVYRSSLERHHYNLQKFARVSDPNYRAVENVIIGLVTDAGDYLKRVSGEAKAKRYHIPFSLEGVPRVKEFVDRRREMEKLEKVLLPQNQNLRQRIFVLHGLGGIGKTQLAVEFARRHRNTFSSVFWLDGRSGDALKQSLYRHAGRVFPDRVAQSSNTHPEISFIQDLNTVVQDLIDWLGESNNTDWLLILDNVDVNLEVQGPDPQAYNVWQALKGADQGSVLITTRLSRLEQLGEAQEISKVDRDLSQEILKIWYNPESDPIGRELLFILLDKLDGLPLGLAQAGAYLQETGVGISKYLEFYEREWKRLMELKSVHDYVEGSIGTTWIISYNSVREKDSAAGILLLLWSFLDNNALGYDLFQRACAASPALLAELKAMVGPLVDDEFDFVQSMQLLRSYSLVRVSEDIGSFTTHPVVHAWARDFQDPSDRGKLTWLAVAVVGWAVPDLMKQDYHILQWRFLPHADACFQWIANISDKKKPSDDSGSSPRIILDGKVLDDALHRLAIFFRHQGKLTAAEELCKQTLQRKREVPKVNHLSIFSTVNLLGVIFTDQGKLVEAENEYMRGLRWSEASLGPNHKFTYDMLNNLGILYGKQGKLADAVDMYKRVLKGKETHGLDPKSTFDTMNNLGEVYRKQRNYHEAENMYSQALQGYKQKLTPNHQLTLQVAHNLGNLYMDQGKLAEAEEMLSGALEGKKKVMGYDNKSTLLTVCSLGSLFQKQNKLDQSEMMYLRAFETYKATVGPDHVETLEIEEKLKGIHRRQGKLDNAATTDEQLRQEGAEIPRQQEVQAIMKAQRRTKAPKQKESGREELGEEEDCDTQANSRLGNTRTIPVLQGYQEPSGLQTMGKYEAPSTMWSLR